MPLTVSVELPAEDRAELTRWLRMPSLSAGLAQRARIVLLAGEGVGTNEIVHRVGVSKPTVIAWKKRYAAEGIAGLDDRAKPGRPAVVDEVAVVLATLEPPPDTLGATHWSSRLLPTGQDELRPVVHSKSASVGREPGVHQHEFVFDRGARRWSYEQPWTSLGWPDLEEVVHLDAEDRASGRV